MQPYVTRWNVVRAPKDSTLTVPSEERWDLAFLGILAYLVVEYARVTSMFPKLGALHAGKVAVGMAAVGYGLYRLGGGRRSNINRIDKAVLAFLLASFLSACFAQYQDLAWAGFAELMRWGVIYFLVARIVANSWRLRIFLFLLLLLNLKLAQFVIRSYFKEIASGLDPTYLAKVGVGTHSGFFANGSDLGLAMCIVVPLAVSLFFGETKTLWQLFFLASSMFFLGAILVCGSRGAQLGAVAIALAAWARQPTKIAVVAMIVLLGVMGVYLLPEASMERMRSALEWEHDKTASHRIFLWKAGLRMFSEHPIIGVGPWNYGPTRARYYPGSDQRTTGTHNTFLQALTELGVLGSVPFLMLLLFLLRLNARTRKRLLALGTASYRSLEYRLALGLDLALVGFLASGFFHNALYFPHLWLLLGLSVGLHTACTQIQPEELSVLLQDERRTVARAVS